MLSSRLAGWLQEYADGHRHPTNQRIHRLAIPLIVFHVLAMLDWVRFGEVGGVPIGAGHVGWVAASAAYLLLHARLGLILTVAFGLCLPVAAVTPAWLEVGIALGAWAAQLAGHAVWERNRPSFLTNIGHALIGPLFFVARLTGDWPARSGSAAG